MLAFTNADVLLRITTTIAAVGIFIGSLEWLKLLTFGAHRRSFVGVSLGRKRRLLQIVLIAQAGAAAATLSGAFDGARTGLIAIMLITLVVNYILIQRGFEASDFFNMGLLSIICLTRVQVVTAAVGCGLICTQGILSYLVAGLSKLASAQWRSGLALQNILSTETFGVPLLLARFPPPARLLRLTSAWVIGIECGVCVLILCPPPSLILGVLSLLALMHLTIARLMGLNLFIWAYLSAFPSYIFVNAAIHGA